MGAKVGALPRIYRRTAQVAAARYEAAYPQLRSSFSRDSPSSPCPPRMSASISASSVASEELRCVPPSAATCAARSSWRSASAWQGGGPPGRRKIGWRRVACQPPPHSSRARTARAHLLSPFLPTAHLRARACQLALEALARRQRASQVGLRARRPPARLHLERRARRRRRLQLPLQRLRALALAPLGLLRAQTPSSCAAVALLASSKTLCGSCAGSH